jgi:hypothetical protein
LDTEAEAEAEDVVATVVRWVVLLGCLMKAAAVVVMAVAVVVDSMVAVVVVVDW